MRALGAAESREAQEGSAQLEVALPSRLDDHIGSRAGMQTGNQARRSHEPARQSEPDTRPLGFIAVGFALLSLVLAPTYFLSLLAYLAAVPAVVLGFITRRDEPTRTMGNAALMLAGAAIVCATLVVFVWN